MELDRTEIVIRQRSSLELMDLSLIVLRRHFSKLLFYGCLLGLPLILVNSLLLTWMLTEVAKLSAPAWSTPDNYVQLRYALHMIVLFTLEFPIVSLPITLYLGAKIFYLPVTMKSVLGQLKWLAWRSVWVLGVVRMGLLGMLFELGIMGSYELETLEVLLLFVLFPWALVIRTYLPFAPEILGLERCSLRSAGPTAITYARRRSGLHSSLQAELFVRMMIAMGAAIALTAMMMGSSIFLQAILMGYWQVTNLILMGILPACLLMVAIVLSVYRYLSYIDCRIRLEGWEIDLRLRAEANRLIESETPEVGSQSTSTLVASSTLSVVLLVLSFLLLLPGQTQAAVIIDENSRADADIARKTITGSWYDRQSQGYSPPKLDPLRDNDLRRTGVVSDGQIQSSKFWETITGFFKSLAEVFRAFLGSLRLIIIAILVLLLVWWIVYITGAVFRNYIPSRSSTTGQTLTIDPARIEDLPFETIQATDDPLAICRAMAAEGRYDQAVLYLYGYQLLALDHARQIHLRKGKTNRMYLRELGAIKDLQELLQATVDCFEAVYFGKHSISAATFNQLWSHIDQFHQLLSRVQPTSGPLPTDPIPLNAQQPISGATS